MTTGSTRTQCQIDNNQQMLVQQILSKFHIDVITKLEERKALTNAWTVEPLFKSTQHYVMIHDNAQQHSTNSTKRSSAKIPDSSKQGAAKEETTMQSLLKAFAICK